ncbi:phytol kinase 2, putative [Acanthamoeba castellanii str. Neff]|uniref:phytol kinase n=1 Tax=Acanthamoeba castellanii (strain ATCC 30010 / Neff) TaxID=1257118 RepID=L8H7K0_ACACF|nr:phytol kinase 2, putative [Acanthamoeba castellanii str. Neff]ELR20703.1 phytol kinase 2, putative [Acanthamoeba castellanii str. Neff]
MVAHLLVPTSGTTVVALLWLKAMETLRDRGVLSANACRKWIHVGTGPLFILCWLAFPQDAQARYWAAVVPGLITLRFALLGLGVLKDEKTVRSLSRTGDRTELLKGPLIYGIIFVVCTCVYWRDSSVGISILLILCAGDGFADLAGRKYGGAARLPHNRSKSWAGSCAFFVASLAFQCAYAHLFHAQGWLRVGLAQSLPTIVAVTLVSTVVESLPVSDWDNLTVSLAAWGCHKLLGSV